MVSLLIVLAILLAIVLGYHTKINTGFFAIVFAYLIGCFAMGLKPKDVISGWPISTMFIILAVSLFYNFALVNGTLDKTARYLLYACRRFPALLPFALYFAAAVIAALGAGFFTVMAFMAPVTLLLCEDAKMDKLTGAVAVNCGALSGANFMTSGSGIIFSGLMENIGFGAQSFQFTGNIFIASVIFSILFIALFFFTTKENRHVGEGIVFEKPEPFTAVQKTNLYLILLMMIVVLIFPIFNRLFSNVKIISNINGKIDVGLVAIIFSVIALLLNLAPQNEVVAKVPWNTILMICGVGMLINVAVKAGTIDLLAAWTGANIPTWALPIAFTAIAAIMSFFSSTLGVVCPALFPIVPQIAAATGIDPVVLFACIVIGGQSSAISPFSSGGSLVLGSCATEEDRNQMFPKLLFKAVPMSVISAIIFSAVMALVL